MSLEKQIHVYSIDTGSLYSNTEKRLHELNYKLRSEKNIMVNGGYIDGRNGTRRKILGINNIIEQLNGYGIGKLEINGIKDNGHDFSIYGNDAHRVYELSGQYFSAKNTITLKNNKIKEIKEKLLLLLSNKADDNIASCGKHHTRELREDAITDANIISVFDSYFTRTIGAVPDELCDDFMIMQVFYFSVLKDLIHNGFVYNGEKYVYFTSSAGQIRTKKAVFVKESTWKKHEKSIMCGLTIDDINTKGGNNPNKHLAYLALANSATDVWEEFDIDKTIVIDDFETNVFGTYDFIDETDYSITRTRGEIPIEHTDGAGMMLPSMGKNRMIRLPWVKGLLGSFDFRKFIDVNGCSPIIKDIYGKEHNVVAEDIQIIFCKSQFKMHKYYDSWDDYKEKYKKYTCSAGITNIEEDRIRNATINYQMLQSLTDISDGEIHEVAEQSVNKLNNFCSSIDNVKRVFDITPYNTNKTAFQKCIELYPDLLNDEYAKDHLRSIKESIIKRCKSGKLDVNGKYTFVLPDFYAACEHWFMGIDNPKGLLDDGEVFCWLFRKHGELDCLRSPHLFMEHPIRKNIAYKEWGERQEKLREWFCTDAVYTSSFDLISKLLQFDDQQCRTL